MLEQTTAMGHPPGTFVIFQAYFKPLQTVQIKKNNQRGDSDPKVIVSVREGM